MEDLTETGVETTYQLHSSSLALELRPRKLRPRKLKPRKLRPRKLRPRKLRPRKLRPRKLRPRKLRPRKLRPRKLRLRKLGPPNIFHGKVLSSSFSSWREIARLLYCKNPENLVTGQVFSNSASIPSTC